MTNIRKIYKCFVWHETFGHDSYLVCASNHEEAMTELENRLENETIYSAKEWEILLIQEVKD